MYLHFFRKKGLNQNPPWFTRYCTTQLTHILKSRPFNPKHSFIHIKTTLLISSKKTLDHSSSFNLLASSFSTNLAKCLPNFQEIQYLDDYTWFVSQAGFWYDSIYSLSTSSCLWRHMIVILLYFCISRLFSYDLIYSHPTSILSWLHPDMLQTLKLHMKIFTCWSIPCINFFHISCLIISFKNCFSSSN